MAGAANLIPLTERDPEEAARLRSMGGKARVQQRRLESSYRAWCKRVAGLPLTKAEQRALEAYQIPEEELTQGAAVVLAMLDKAKGGDVDAARWLRDTSGEAPTQFQQVQLSSGSGLGGMSDAELVELAGDGAE